MADETVLDSQTELHNSDELPRRAQPGHGRDTAGTRPHRLFTHPE